MSDVSNKKFSLEPDEHITFEARKSRLQPYELMGVILGTALGLIMGFAPALFIPLLWFVLIFLPKGGGRLCLTNKRLIVSDKSNNTNALSIPLSSIVAFWKGGEKLNLVVGVCDISINVKDQGVRTFEGLSRADEFAADLARQLGFKSTDGAHWTA